jgi:hypothetical protein
MRPVITTAILALFLATLTATAATLPDEWREWRSVTGSTITAVLARVQNDTAARSLTCSLSSP